MNKILSIIFIAVMCISPLQANSISYDRIVEAKSKRMNKYLIRFFRTLDSFCIGYVDSIAFVRNKDGVVITPTKWEIYKTLPLCEVAGKSTGDGYTHASIIDLKFLPNSIQMLVSTTPLEPRGEEIRKCIIYVNNGEFSELKCDEPKPINTLTSDQLKL